MIYPYISFVFRYSSLAVILQSCLLPPHSSLLSISFVYFYLFCCFSLSLFYPFSLSLSLLKKHVFWFIYIYIIFVNNAFHMNHIGTCICAVRIWPVTERGYGNFHQAEERSWRRSLWFTVPGCTWVSAVISQSQLLVTGACLHFCVYIF